MNSPAVNTPAPVQTPGAHAPGGAHDLTGRTALITGAARGMGRAHALALAARGARVALADLDQAELAATAAEVAAAGGRAAVFTADITSRTAAESLIEAVAADFGGLDVLVHNAGLMFAMTGLADTDDEDFDRLLAVNVRAPLYLTRAALPHLRRSPAARVVFVSSQWGQVPDGHSYGYMVSKAAQLGLMKTLAKEFAAERITVNAVAPGAVATRMVPPENHEAEVAAVPVGRLGQPWEIAEVVAFLAADTGAFVTGQTIPVNGGALLVGI
ncbi:SDR family NAD(P)-dependent oxidoreductase [Peterkaempfera bronchialis]|uniref:SDR family NAD(P)-dependent oxidoreductase n=1 Tax=Peterkaempfera bronchialis TaxID=2126346 RepID=UPI001E407638|nr:SDR family NAD(P)-dependent oxidoreductase [Peterkaempfera bronchialis]